MKLAPSTRLTPHPDVQARDMDGEVVLLNVRTGAYFGLNRVASHVWSLFGDGLSLADVVSGVCDRFEVDRQRAEADVRDLTAKLVELDLLRP